MIDYEKLADGVEIPSTPSAPFNKDTLFHEGEAIDPVANPSAAQALLNKVYLPLNHEKYQGIATAKGYAQGEDFSGNRLVRVHYSHEAMIDVLLAEPTITQRELAKRFDRSENWISIVIGSDSFQAALAKRRDDLMNPEVIATIEERLTGLAHQSLQVIAENLEKTRNIDVAFKAIDISTKALGFGARNSGNAAIQNNFVVQLPPKIDSASDWAATHSGGPVIEGS